MGNYLFSGGNTQNNDFSNFDISSLNLSENGDLMGGGNDSRYNQYNIFKIIADMEQENGMGGGKNNGFSDTITNYDSMINEIKNSILSKKNKLRGGGCNKCGLNNSLECSCNSNISGGEALGIGDADALRKHINTTLDNHNYSQTSSVNVKISPKMAGGKKSKKSKKNNSSSVSITSSSSSSSYHSSNSVSSSSSSSSDNKKIISSAGGSDNKLSIFPFNSTTNSVSEKNFRLLRRRL